MSSANTYHQLGAASDGAGGSGPRSPAQAPPPFSGRPALRDRISRVLRQHRIAGAVISFVLAGALVVALASVAGGEAPPGPSSLTPAARACTVFCAGPILRAVQSAAIFNDSKTFVDMPLLVDPEEALAAFAQLPAASNGDAGTGKSIEVDRAALSAFVARHFGDAGSDLLPWTPPDFAAHPSMLGGIVNASVRAWGAAINERWLLLGRQVAPSVVQAPQRHSLLPLKHPVVVPGGRFRGR